MAIFFFFSTPVTPTSGQSAVATFYGPAGKTVLREYFTGITVDSSVFASKADLRDTFVGSLNQTQAVIGQYRGYPTFKNNVVTSTNLVINLDIENPSSYSGSGTTWSSLVNSIDFTLTNGPTYTSGSPSYFTADGINDYIISPNIKSNFGTNDISVFLWVYPIAAGQIYVELGQTTINTGWHASNIEINSSGAFSFSLWHNSLTNKVVSSNQSFNQWYYVGLTYSGTTLTAYINGASIGTATFTRSVNAAFYVALFATDSTNMGTTGYSNSRINSFHMYSSALTAGEVLQNYTALKSRFGL